MGKPYSTDLRKRVVAAVEKEGLSRHQAASRFDLGVSTVINWVRREPADACDGLGVGNSSRIAD